MVRNWRRILVAFAAWALLLTGVASAQEVIEQYRGNAVAMGTVATGAKKSIDIGIFRFSTDEERTRFRNILKEQGAGALYDAMSAGPEVAFLRIDGSLAYKLRVAREFTDPNGKRHLVFAAERPLTADELRKSDRTADYNFSVVELIVDAKGKGQGTFYVGAQVTWNAEKDNFDLKSYSTEPMRILNVTRSKPK